VIGACLALSGSAASARPTDPALSQQAAIVVASAAAVAVADHGAATAVRAPTALERRAERRLSRAAQRTATRARIIALARKQLGDRYSAGRSGPSAFDCSGLVRYVYKVAAGKQLPHSSRAQYDRVVRIPRSQARPGDLVFFLRGGAHHVGIYLGSNRMIDAAGYGEGVRISPTTGSWWSRSYTGMGRLV
jgi:cell wall-associated NlpC family hydrolase